MIEALAPKKKALLFLALCLATLMLVIDYAIANISLPYIASDLGVATDQGTYVVTWYAVGNAVGLAMTGWLTKKIGEVRLIVLSIALFTVFSLACGLSGSLLMLMFNRFMQGLVGGPIIPLCQTMIVEYSTLLARRRDIAIWGLMVVTGPILGPITGGYITYWYSWPWIFYINIPFGIFCTFAIWAVLKDRESKTEKTSNDILGMILLVVGVTALQIFLDKGQDWDWLNSMEIRLLIICTVLAFTYLIIHEIWNPEPFLNLRLFAYPSFALSIICLAISFAIYFGSIVITPLWLQEYMNYTPVWAGLAVASQGIGPLLLGAFTVKIIHKIGNLRTLALSFVFFALGCFYQSFFTTDVTIERVSFARFVFGMGFILYITPLLAISIEGIPQEQLPNATGIFHFFRALFGGIGTSIFKTIFERRTIYHHETIGAGLTRSNPVLPSIDLNKLNAMVDNQAALLAINDSFYLMGWCFAFLILLVIIWFFWKRRHPTAASEATDPIMGE